MADHDSMIAQLEGMKGKGKKAPAKKTGGKRESAKAVMTGKGKVGIAGNPAAVEETKEDVEAGGKDGPEECPTCGSMNPAGTIEHRLANLKAKAEIAQALAEEARKAAEAIEASNAAVRANRDKVLGEWSKGIQEKGDRNREAYRNAPAPKAEDSESEEEGAESESDKEAPPPKKEETKTDYPLVSREQYVKHIKLLSSAMDGKKALVKDRPLQQELADAFFHIGRMSEIGRAFLNGLVYIYNDTQKRPGRYRKSPTKLEWNDWFDARKTDQANGMAWTQGDNYQFGALEKYFNIYRDASGKRDEFRPKEYGYFFGFGTAEEAPKEDPKEAPKEDPKEAPKEDPKEDKPKRTMTEAQKAALAAGRAKAKKARDGMTLPPREPHNYGGEPWRVLFRKFYDWVDEKVRAKSADIPEHISLTYAGNSERGYLNGFRVIDAVRDFGEPWKQLFKDFLEAKRGVQHIFIGDGTSDKKYKHLSFFLTERDGKLHIDFKNY